MTTPNRIREIQVLHHRLDPAETELWLSVRMERVSPATAVRGRLIGPRCPYSTTVEVAYPLREWSRDLDQNQVNMRVIIPEASFWEPETPFLYQGPIELWEGDECRDRMQVTHGLSAIHLGARGFVVNGRPFEVRGVTCRQATADDGHAWRRHGFNTLLAPVDAESLFLWDLADRIGFFLFGFLESKEALESAAGLRQHPSCLGWILGAALADDAACRLSASRLSPPGRRHFLGVGLIQPCSTPLADAFSFIVCPESILDSIAEVPLPKVILTTESWLENGKAHKILSAQPILGWIRNE